MTELRQAIKYAKWLSMTGFEVVKIKSSTGEQFGYVRRLLGIGMMKVQRYEGSLDLDDLRRVIKDKGIFFVILEPIESKEGDRLLNNGFRLETDGYLPSKTLVKRISGKVAISENHKRIMKHYKKSQEIEIGEVSAAEWVEGYKREGKLWLLNKQNLIKAKQVFGKQAVYWGAKEKDRVICGVMILIEDKTAYYFSAYAGERARELQLGVVTLILLIEELKKRGVEKLDFDGIYDSRFPRASWKGFSEFKRRFGGDEVLYPGSFSKRFYPWS